jgi:hypothetical protein
MTGPFSKIRKNVFPIVSMAALSFLLGASAFAQRSDKATVVTFNAPVEIPGSNPQVLPAGSYMFKLVNSKSSPHIVQISNKDESMVYSTVVAIPAYRDASTRDTVVTFQERGASRPQAIEKWFYPNDIYGEEFVYGPPPPAPQPQVAAAAPPARPAPAPAPPAAAPPAPAPAPPAPEPVRPAEPERAAAPPPQAPPAPAATPAPTPTPAPAQPEPQQQTQQPQALPHTASHLPLIFLAGLLALGTGWTLRRLS